MNKWMRRSISALALAGAAIVCLIYGARTGASGELSSSSAARDFVAMDTAISITCYGPACEEALQAVVDEINRLDKLLSIGDPDSEVFAINAGRESTLSEDTAKLVQRSLKLNRDTDGAFDITVAPLMELWGFTSGVFTVPDAASVEAARALCDSRLLRWDDGQRKLTLPEGGGIDFGGIAKGYASDRMFEVWEQYDISGAIASLGGNVICYHGKETGDGWKIGIKDPEHTTDYFGAVEVTDAFVITSGAYERFYEDPATGKRYAHIMNPKTGMPVEGSLSSVTIVGRDGCMADALSTACYVMGLDQAVTYWQQHRTEFDMILMDESGKVYVTEGIEHAFSTDRAYTVLK